jgi:hypothetical protein
VPDDPGRHRTAGSGCRRALIDKGLPDALGARDSDALVDRQCLAQVGGTLAGLTVLKVAVAESFQRACFLQGRTDITRDGQCPAVVVTGLLAGRDPGGQLTETAEHFGLLAPLAEFAVQPQGLLMAGFGGRVVAGELLNQASFAGVPNYVHQHDLGLVVGGWAPDWPDGFGFLYYLTAGAAIQPVANSNISELNDPAVNNMFTRALVTTSIAARTRIWSQIDRRVMSDAVILPGVYARVLLYRSPHLTNVYGHRYYGMYDYASLGFN